jgi:hypothetical protein
VSSLACGSSSPTAPSNVQVAGVWSATDRFGSATGGDCVGPTLTAIDNGTFQAYSVQISQNGSALTAIVTSNSNGVTTNYSGTAGESSITLNATFSTAATVFGVHCLNGALRDINLTNSTITATMNGNSGSGTNAASYNVFAAGTTTGVGILTINSTFSMTKQ